MPGTPADRAPDLNVADQEWEPYEADTDGMVEKVLREYDNPAQAIEFNVIQNSWDARVDGDGRVGSEGTGPWTDWRCEITYSPNKRQLWIEDYGTTGIVHWEKYRGIGFTSKDLDADAGGHGEGSKALAVVGRRVYTETMLRDGTKRYDLWERGKRSKNPPRLDLLTHIGTLIIVDGVVDEASDQPVHELLVDDDRIVKEIQISWDDIIRHNNAKIIYRCNRETIVPPLEWPKAVFSQEYSDVEVRTRTKSIGTIPAVYLALAEKELPREIQGLHLRVHGQTVLRYQPPFLGPSIASRLYGWCSLDYLARSKMRGHQGFVGRNWGETKRVLERVIQEFREKYLAREAEPESRYRKMSSTLLRMINACLQAVPELDPGGRGKRKEPPPPPTTPEIDEIELSDREIKRGETVDAIVVTVNRVAGRSFDGCVLKVTLLDPNGTEATTPVQSILAFSPGDRRETPVEYLIPESGAKGRYVVSASLTGPDEAVYDTATASFHVEPEPEVPSPPSEGEKTRAEKTRPTKDGRKARGLRDVKVGRFKVPPGEPAPESSFDEDRLVLAVNTAHPSWTLAERLGPKSLWMFVARCAANELSALKLTRDTIEVVRAAPPSEKGLGDLEDKLRAIQEEVRLHAARFTARFAQLNLPRPAPLTVANATATTVPDPG